MLNMPACEKGSCWGHGGVAMAIKQWSLGAKLSRSNKEGRQCPHCPWSVHVKTKVIGMCGALSMVERQGLTRLCTESVDHVTDLLAGTVMAVWLAITTDHHARHLWLSATSWLIPPPPPPSLHTHTHTVTHTPSLPPSYSHPPWLPWRHVPPLMTVAWYPGARGLPPLLNNTQAHDMHIANSGRSPAKLINAMHSIWVGLRPCWQE